MFEDHLANTLAIIQSNPLIGAGILAVVAVLFYFRPKDMLKLVGFCLFMVVVFYILSLLLETVGSGGKQKDQMIYKSRAAIGE
jgi:ABC-type uncharacterized transport system permease subunit